MAHLTAVILAAGPSTRWGAGQKLLGQVGSRSLLQIAIENFEDTSVDEILFITGFEAQKTEAELAAHGIAFRRSLDYAMGIMSSVQTAIRNVSAQTDGVLICLGDLAGLTPQAIERVVRVARQNKDKLVAPIYKGTQGHPSYIPRKFFAEILSMPPQDKGCRFLFKQYPEEVILVPFATDEILKDVDRPSDIEAI